MIGPLLVVVIVDGADGREVVWFPAGDAEDDRARSFSTSPGLASLGLRRSEISTFEDW